MKDQTLQRQTERQVQQSLNAYVQSERWKKLDDVDQESATGFVKLFLDAAHKEVGLAPADLDAAQMREVLLARVATRIASKRRDAERAMAVIRDYYEHIASPEDKTHAALFDEAEKALPAILRGEQAVEVERAQPLQAEADKVGRNDPCPCGSGKKHKKCCGR